MATTFVSSSGVISIATQNLLLFSKCLSNRSSRRPACWGHGFSSCWWSDSTHICWPAGWEIQWSCPRQTHLCPCAACRGCTRWGRAAPPGMLWWSRNRTWADMTAPTRALSARGQRRRRERMWDRLSFIQRTSQTGLRLNYICNARSSSMKIKLW